MIILVVCSAQLDAQRAEVDPAIADSARAAVQKLGLEMMKGNFKYSQQRMYPRWKRRLAKRMGGMVQLERQLAAGDQQRIKLGVVVTDYRAGAPRAFFNVWRAPKIDALTGKPVMSQSGKEVIVEHWLAVVPTTTQVKLADTQRGGKMRVLEEQSYTVAISEKGTDEWYFLTGMKPTIQDLRSLFPSLPRDEKELGLPTSSAREIK